MLTFTKPSNVPPKLYENFWLDAVAAENKKIGLYCGSFNPMHKAHAALCTYVLENTDLQRVWLSVSPRNPLKQSDDLMNDDLRLHLARLATAELQNVDVCDIEMRLPKPSYTINTLRQLKKEYPDTDFSLIIGADNAEHFDRWRDYDKILADFDVIALRRPGSDVGEAAAKFPSMHFLDSPLMDVSSTQIRANLKNGEPISQWVCPEVERVLTELVKDRGYAALFSRIF